MSRVFCMFIFVFLSAVAWPTRVKIPTQLEPARAQREGITTLRIYQYLIFHHTVIETCFEMLKSPELGK